MITGESLRAKRGAFRALENERGESVLSSLQFFIAWGEMISRERRGERNAEQFPFVSVEHHFHYTRWPPFLSSENEARMNSYLQSKLIISRIDPWAGLSLTQRQAEVYTLEDASDQSLVARGCISEITC